MSDIDPEELFKSFNEGSLVLLAEKASIPIPSKKRNKGVDKDKLIEDLVKSVTREGTKRVLGVIKVPRMKELVDYPEMKLDEKWTPPEKKEKTPKKGEKKTPKKETKPYPNKQHMTKIIEEFIEEKGWKDYLDILSQKTLLNICKDVDDLSELSKDELNFSKKEMIKAIMTNVYNFGLNHILSLLNVDELKAICKTLGLEHETGSQEYLIDSIIEKKDFKRVKKKTVKPSSSKPSDIKKGISRIDLKTWFSIEELEKWLKDKKSEDVALKDMPTTGKKSVLIDRVSKILEGDIAGATKKKGKRGRSKSKSRSEEVEKETKKRKKTDSEEEK